MALIASPRDPQTKMPTFAELHDLSGQVAVVTGGSRGIVRAIVQVLAEAGAALVIASRKRRM